MDENKHIYKDVTVARYNFSIPEDKGTENNVKEDVEATETKKKIIVPEQNHRNCSDSINESGIAVSSEMKEVDNPLFKEDVYQPINSSNDNSTSNGKTVGFYNLTTEPVVGWLVCVTGEIKGKCFKLKSGQNIIGNSVMMDINIPSKNKKNSSEKYALLIFEPLKRTFFIQPIEGANCKLNAEKLLKFEELGDYDKLEIEDFTFIFKKLCGEDFSWENYQK